MDPAVVKQRISRRAALFFASCAFVVGPVAAQPTHQPAGDLYRQHCATCHGEQRLGSTGPALLPESLERLRKAEAENIIATGRVATQMPGFGNILPADTTASLVQWLYTPVSPAPAWADADIRASRTELSGAGNLPAKPAWNADPMNLFVVIEAGDDHVALVDGSRFQIMHRFASRHALHGAPKFTPDGRYIFLGSRDGWITKYDLWNLIVVAEVRAGLSMRNVAISGDGRWVMAANSLPRTLALFDADLNLVRSYPATTLDGKASSRVSAVHGAAPRHSFVVTFTDIAELWEISYDPKAEPIYDGLVHDYKMGEAIAKPGYLGVRRTPLEEPLGDFILDESFRHAIGTARPKGNDAPLAQVINLDVRRRIASFPLSGAPHPGSAITFAWNGSVVLAISNREDGTVTVLNTKTWKVVKTIATAGAGYFMRSHEHSPYVWADSMMSTAARDTLTVIDKRTLEPAALVRVPGHSLAHIEFTKDGRYAVASLMETDGAIIVYDATTLQEVKRLSMRKPIGKYNVWNSLGRFGGVLQ